jgi:hypothetical protein
VTGAIKHVTTFAANVKKALPVIKQFAAAGGKKPAIGGAIAAAFAHCQRLLFVYAGQGFRYRKNL